MAPLSLHKQTYQIILMLGLMSAGLLAAAFAFEIFGGLLPCKLCVWQRWPHAFIFVTAILGLVSLQARLVFVLIAGMALTNTGLSFYHIGIEQQFWQVPASCSSALDSDLSSGELLDLLLATPVIRCDEIAWTFLGGSMAGWNMLFSLAQAGLAGKMLFRA